MSLSVTGRSLGPLPICIVWAVLNCTEAYFGFLQFMFMDWYFYHQPTVGSDYTRPVLSVFFHFPSSCCIFYILHDSSNYFEWYHFVLTYYVFTMHIYTFRHTVHFTKLFFSWIILSFSCRGFFLSRTYCTLIWSEEFSFEFSLLWILFPFVFLICHIEAENICLSTHPVGIAPYHQLYCRLPVSVSLICLPAHFVFVSVVHEWFYCGNKRFFRFQGLFFIFPLLSQLSPPARQIWF